MSKKRLLEELAVLNARGVALIEQCLNDDSVPMRVRLTAFELSLAYQFGRPSVSIEQEIERSIQTIPMAPPKPGETCAPDEPPAIEVMVDE